jgi:hypothetical protein
VYLNIEGKTNVKKGEEMKRTLCIGSIVFIMCVSLGGWGATWYVDGSASEFGDGSSPDTPLETIQEGIDAASEGDAVFVAEELYAENIRFNGKNIVVRSIDPLDPDVVASTIIDGNYGGSVVTFDGTEDGTCVLSGFTIRNGNASIGGGINGAGLGGMGTHATIENNVITSNSAVDWGGAMAYCDGAIQNNRITNNRCSDAAGLYACDGIIQNNVISGNTGTSLAGGLCVCGGIIQNNVVADNSAVYGGGMAGCGGIIWNNTIVGNSGGSIGGGLYGCVGVIENCIIWGNTASSGPQVAESSQPSYSCIQDWAGGEGNISENPQFVKVGYQLKPDSPCIDAGKNEDWMWDAVDLDGKPRVAGHKVDMGAYEYDREVDTCPPYVWDRDPAPDAVQVAVGANIVLHVKDQGSGVDETSIVMTVNGSQLTPTIAGTPADYTLTYDPPSDFSYSETVTVTVDAADLSTPPNVMERVTYSFTTIREPSPARTWYVDGSVPVSGDGTSWETAFVKIQEGIDAAADGDTVIVSPGTYVENIRFESRNITLRSTDPSDPAVVANTIIDGGQSGSVAAFSGTEDETCVLSGFTIRNGKGVMGGGICGGTPLEHTHATIENNIITANSADGAGGLAWCDSTIRSNTISGNAAAIGSGGGLSRCGGIIENNSISGNSGLAGAGLFRCDGLVQNNEILENSAFHGGGLAWCEGTIRSSLIAGNSATANGGGMAYCNRSIENNTIVGNSASNMGGGVQYCLGTIRNCIIWGNSAPTGPQVHWSNPTYSCIQGGGGGEGNISADPEFVDPGEDYRLSQDSPCIDVGMNEDWMWDAADLDGVARILRGDSSLTVDMGAYEYYDETINTSPPYASKLSPAPDATDVQVNSNIVLHLKDDGHGVDKASIVMTVNGLQVIPTITGTPSDFTVTYDPPSFFDLSQTVTVTVDAQDRCSPAKVMEQVAYSFTTMAVDVIPPEITLSGNSTIVLLLGNSFEDPGCTAMDHPDGDLSSNVAVTGFVDPNVVGTYTLQYNVSDAAGNPAEEKTRTVKVVSPFGVTSILAGGGAIAVMWDSQPEATYTIWCCSDLASGKWNEEATVPSQGQSTNWIDLSPPAMCGFYRIERTD